MRLRCAVSCVFLFCFGAPLMSDDQLPEGFQRRSPAANEEAVCSLPQALAGHPEPFVAKNQVESNELSTRQQTQEIPMITVFAAGSNAGGAGGAKPTPPGPIPQVWNAECYCYAGGICVWSPHFTCQPTNCQVLC
jgi:hypothetical protein